MARISLAADNTTLTLNGRILRDFPEGEEFTLTPVNPLTSHTNSSNGGVTIHETVNGGVHDLVIRVQKFSDDDVFLNSLRNNPSTIIDGSSKEIFVKDDTEGVDTHELQTGSITNQPTVVRTNVEGDSLMEYTIRFRNVVRSI